MTDAIRAEGLVKQFKGKRALDGVDLTARTGAVLGVLGPNGSGKTTMVRILATLLRPDGGHAEVGGYDVVRQPHEVRRLIGLTGQYAAVDADLTGTQNLILIARLLGFDRAGARVRAAELLERFGLADAAGRPAKTYSGGMRRRLDLAASLVGRPALLYLDEPTTGLDPHSRNGLWDVVRGLVDDGVTVLLTTQYLEEADRLADRISVVSSGRVVAEGTPEELKSRLGGDRLDLVVRDPAELDAAAGLVRRVVGARPETDAENRRISVGVENRVAALTEVARALEDHGVEVEDIALRRPSLDEVFLHLTENEEAPVR